MVKPELRSGYKGIGVKNRQSFRFVLHTSLLVSSFVFVCQTNLECLL